MSIGAARVSRPSPSQSGKPGPANPPPENRLFVERHATCQVTDRSETTPQRSERAHFLSSVMAAPLQLFIDGRETRQRGRRS
jgi:hypothetical protein